MLWFLTFSYPFHTEGRGEIVSKEDYKFLHNLSLRDARKHLPHLRTLAKREHPGLPTSGLIITINYTKTPAIFGLKVLRTYTQEVERFFVLLVSSAVLTGICRRLRTPLACSKRAMTR
jgi:hypothetical protein